MWWTKDITIKSRNEKLKIDEPHFIVEKIIDLSSDDFQTDLISLQRNLDYWFEYYNTYSEILIDHKYNRYCDGNQYSYFLSGIRLETTEELSSRLALIKKEEESKLQAEQEKKDKEIKQKKELFEKLKKELKYE